MTAAAKRLGIPQLYPAQREIIRHALGGRDVLAVLPTGSGKSACYQIPAMVLPKPVVVVSPLLALLKDQHDKLEARGIAAVRVDSTIRGGARRAALERIGGGGPLLVMTTPETLGRAEIAEALGRSGVSAVAVDEAHMASEWGHDFRPAYLRIGEVISRYGAPTRLAFTATATARVREDLVRILGMKDPFVLAMPPDRPNLRFQVVECSGPARIRALTRFVLRLKRPGIVYCATTKDVDAVYGALGRLRVPIHRYHGKMTQTARREEQEQFMSPKRKVVMVATSAFGLGIDKADIRHVVHYQAPASLEQYVQEAGRAGRDGKPADTILLYAAEDREIHEFLLAQTRVRSDQLASLLRVLAAWPAAAAAPRTAALAVAARQPKKVVEALGAVLEEAGLLEFDTEGRVHKLGSASALREAGRRLVHDLARLRELDRDRLDAIADYATTARCRAQSIRAYFGVEIGKPCGVCDVCRGRGQRPETFFEPLRGKRPRGRGGRGARRGRSSRVR